MKYFDPFILPFTIGLYFIFIFLAVKFSWWIIRLDHNSKQKIKQGLFSLKTLSSVKEIFMESLLHRKIFKVNPVLGYMHMSLAFGWFLLIVFGKLGTLSYTSDFFNPLHYAIFFKFFEPVEPAFFYSKTYAFLMDFLLLFILSGLSLAIIKRFKSKLFGLKKTSKHRLGDKIALSFLWWIFPLRLLAESFTCGVYHSGHFLTGTLGSFFASFLPVEQLMYPAWWAYSLSLGLFFVALPYSRYMHIPTEMLLIFLRNYGIKASQKNPSFNEIEVSSCSKCGICIDQCQLSVAGEKNAQPIYFLQAVRNKELKPEISMNCLQCGKCEEVCPVDIEIKDLRLIKRNYLTSDLSEYDFLPEQTAPHADVIYFAGCMTHLTPGIKNAMIKILKNAGVNYFFMDEAGGLCCGRPLKLAGETRSAQKLVDYNRALIKKSRAKILLTSCPICYKIFKEDYDLNIEVLHHSEFLWRLIRQKQLLVNLHTTKIVYHDPCELGRGSGVYEAPRKLIEKVASLVPAGTKPNLSPCCGNSLANLQLQKKQVDLITQDALNSLLINKPDVLATSCPLCKKTFAKFSDTPVKDIAELVAESVWVLRQKTSANKQNSKKEAVLEDCLAET